MGVEEPPDGEAELALEHHVDIVFAAAEAVEGAQLMNRVHSRTKRCTATATFPVGGVIPGWQEGLQLMSEGGKSRLVVPSALAYGERGAGQDTGPNATLIFEVELIKANQ